MGVKKLGLLLCLGLIFLLAACGNYTPTGSKYYTPLINEVYTNATAGSLQWVEIYNNSNNQANSPQAIDLSGWTLSSSQGHVTLNGSIPVHGFLLVASDPNALRSSYPNILKGNAKILSAVLDGSAALGNLDPRSDVVVLKDTSGEVIDQVGWGNPSPDLITKAGANPGNAVNLNLPAPADATKSLGRTPPGTVLDGVPPSNPGYFTIHDTTSPGGPVRADVSKYSFILSTGSDFMTYIGGGLLWLAFVMIAVIAQRFEVLAEQKTYWQLLLGAPIGIAIYDVILGIAYTINHGSLENWQKWVSFTPLFLSGVFCLWVINIFRLVAKNILEAE